MLLSNLFFFLSKMKLLGRSILLSLLTNKWNCILLRNSEKHKIYSSLHHLCHVLEGWDGEGEEGSWRGKGHTYTYGWFTLWYGRHKHNRVKQLSSNKRKFTSYRSKFVVATHSLAVIFTLSRRTRFWGVIWVGYCLKSVPMPSFWRKERGAEW